jgi:hypothetical protein
MSISASGVRNFSKLAPALACTVKTMASASGSELPHPWDILPSKAEKTLAINDVYVPINTIRAIPVLIPPGAKQAHIKLTYLAATTEKYGHEVRTTARMEVTSSAAGQIGFDEAFDLDVPKESFFWRDGDDADLWVTINILNPKTAVGNRFKINFGGGGLAGPVATYVQVAESATNELPAVLPYHRPPYMLDLEGVIPTHDLDMMSVDWSDTGYQNGTSSGRPVWRTRPSHGRSNFSANGETGLYMDEFFDPKNSLTPHSKDVDSNGRPFVKLHSDKFAEPVNYKGKDFYQQAAMLQGQKMSEWHHRRGVYRAQIVAPSQRGAWSAWWAVGLRLSTQTNMWPPEIDFMEHFNGAFNNPFDQYTSASGQHAGPHGDNRQRVDSNAIYLDKLGWDSSFNLWTQIHDYVCVIDDEWVTHLIDGVETFRNRNISDAADGNTDWAYYPVINIAVRTSNDASYNEGTKDLLWYGMQYYEPSIVPQFKQMTDDKPWPLNISALPDIIDKQPPN